MHKSLILLLKSRLKKIAELFWNFDPLLEGQNCLFIICYLEKTAPYPYYSSVGRG